MAGGDGAETVALVFPGTQGEMDATTEAALIDVEGPIDDIIGDKRGIVFAVWQDVRGIRKALRAAGAGDRFYARGEHVIYGRILEEDKKKLTVAPIIYEEVAPKHNETRYEDGVTVRLSTSQVKAGKILVARGVDLGSLEKGTAETSRHTMKWIHSYRHASQSETFNMGGGAK